MLRPLSRALATLTLVAFAAAPALAEDAQTTAVVPFTGKVCPVGGDPVDASSLRLVHEGREVRLCCESCVGKFQKDPAKYLAAMDEQAAEAQRPLYPMTTCVVGGGELGSMGEPHELMHEGRLVRLCCEGCVGDFQKDPAGHLAKLDQAVIEQQSASYPLKTCAVSDEALGAMGAPTDVVVANRLVRLCCEGCEPGLREDPAAALAKVDAAWRASVKAGAPTEAPAKAGDDHADHQH